MNRAKINRAENDINERLNAPRGRRCWVCVVCGYIYDERKGMPEDGIAPGTAWEDVPEDWECPKCGVSKADFTLLTL